MKHSITILAFLSLIAFAGQIPVNLGPIDRTDGDWLRYDNGTGSWLTWGGLYKGVWFDMEDFSPGATSASVLQSEFWFYHHSSYAWDTSDFYTELWNGTAPNLTTLLDQTTVTAIHYAPVCVSYSAPIITEENFWCLANTEMSTGGWPSIISDNAGSTVAHSFYGDTDMVMSPYSQGGTTCNYFIAVEVQSTSLDRTTWGSLKSVF